jgi:hypothetical protein
LGTNGYEIFTAMHRSAGMAFLNRKKLRSFTLNIFTMNSKELREALVLISNPTLGLELMKQENSEAGHQAHREVNRLFHNFLAGSKTLVDHTRALIDDFYKKTDIERSYRLYLESHIAKDEVCRFMHDLRNYTLHHELPLHKMYVTIKKDEGLTTGVMIDVEMLRQWDRWTRESHRYILKQGKEIYPLVVIDQYSNKITNLHEWLNTELEKYHANDLAELKALQEEYDKSSREQ